ncbi:hypothetical protein FHS15_002716 [Paenibacillus castaneae]|uniref:hypothetical protein n=1 Tax=Paenibacillus castaneae TaxID=474957 RepID=UPI000C9BE8C6|nr:hypothetical protein [Paenibacillus castaneae]NIK77580.1 hypothetical protein [Paenibacillus castaneae]
MKIIKPLLTACIAVLAVTLLLSWLPQVATQQKSKKGDVAVFRATPAVRLTNDNLVDVLVAIQLNERVNKAEWSNGILSVVIKVNAEKGRPSIWFNDVEKLVRVSFVQLDNVKRVLIRIVEERSGEFLLLAAVDVRKTDSWLANELDLLAHADAIHDELWRKRLRISFTSTWEEQFGKVSGYTVKPSSISEF